ncbi:MAG TPA: HPF/RaiA family ribosome-associated protein [Kofleriaceae bacterium]|nr:HPF/RaiA family ribosome-associated protein [Kofleriaceae bacterium]
MQVATTFRDMVPSPALQAAAERWAARLEHVSARIVGCHVSVEKPHRHHLHGSPFQINIVLDVPGGQIAVTNQTHTDAYVALADAFRAARRQLLERTDLQRNFVKGPAGGHYTGFVANKP